LQSEQRRLLLLELLAKENTPNRIRQEAFIKLIEDYREKDFSGLQITNLKEGYKTPFSFVKCFEKFKNYSIAQDTIVRLSFNPKKKNYKKIITLTKFNLWNTNLQYADFSATTQKRIYDDAKWLIYDELGAYDYVFVFEYLVDTNLSFTDLTEATFEKANLENVDFSNATLENANFRKAVFSHCNLNGANFRGANLDSTVFDQTEISETTDFVAVRNYTTIRLASPYIIHTIKKHIFLTKKYYTGNLIGKESIVQRIRYLYKNGVFGLNLNNNIHHHTLKSIKK
jgi:uncharacterized protein YjbI with pentapeptide repeats